MTDYVVDASVLLAYLNEEPGATTALEYLIADASISAVNLAEVVTKRIEGSDHPEALRRALASIGLPVIDVTTEVAFLAGTILAEHRRNGLSLADAVCVATARTLGATAVTADRAWNALPDRIEVIR